MDILTVSLIASTLVAATPLIWAAMGGLVSHQAGLFNFTLEGLMLFGAFFSVLFGTLTGNVWIGILLSGCVCVLLSLIWGWIVIDLEADQIISALGFILLAQGGTVFMLNAMGQGGGIFSLVQLNPIKIPLVHDIPLIGPVLSNQTALTYLSWLLLPLFLFALYRTPFGLSLRATGERPEAAEAAGINVRRMRYISVAITGFCCAMAGSQLALGLLAMFTDNMTAGRGIIAFAAVIFGLHRPLQVFLVALFFGFAGALTDRLQGFGLPSELLLTLPYVLTVLALCVAGMQSAFKRRVGA
ncbi:ABC transporter permease [Pseudaminobacter sp. 19-2017]|uniref:ABC transporter permease n=1 Tax=Pseudaminobacter soli (ex Zhang et al. 2022) TaxID=2831468 RepID=A0A942I3X2_9HYPH|nr:ABC transporter permease [Pseudaminobacter soli]MBS3651018.1 ABC transporter permease [Pseudaminobacter soli]